MHKWLKDAIKENIDLMELGQFRKFFKKYPEGMWYQLAEIFDAAEIDYKTDFMNFIDSYLNDSDLESLVSKDVSQWTLSELTTQVTKFISDINKFSLTPYMDEEVDKGLLYTKYEPFVTKCKEFRNKITKNDINYIAMRELCQRVEYYFPFGNKIFKNYYINDILHVGKVLDT